MPFGAKIHPSGKIIEIWYPSGVFTADSIRKSTVDAIKLHHESGIDRFLMDSTSLKFVENLLEVSNLPKLYDQLGMRRQVRAAVVAPLNEVTQRVVALYISRCQSAGWDVQLFETRPDAVSWLLS